MSCADEIFGRDGAGCPPAVICSALIRGGTRLHHEAGQPEPLDEIVSALI